MEVNPKGRWIGILAGRRAALMVVAKFGPMAVATS